MHKLKLSRVSRKERFLRDIKFKLWNNKRYITVTLRGVLERERGQEEELFTRERLVVLKCRERANNNLNNRGVPE